MVSYVGIRGDEDREGYISTKNNIQSIFPFRQNIWSEDVIRKVLGNQNIEQCYAYMSDIEIKKQSDKFLTLLTTPLSMSFNQASKLKSLIDVDTRAFNQMVFSFLKTTEYPLAQETYFPLLENEENLNRDDIFEILENSGVGVPKYYKGIGFQHKGKSGSYARSRSGCYFCFYQQKIEWVWLYEQHPELYTKAMDYEKDGYTWMQEESLAELINPGRIAKIKEEYIKKTQRNKDNEQSPYLQHILVDAESDGCASCFI